MNAVNQRDEAIYKHQIVVYAEIDGLTHKIVALKEKPKYVTIGIVKPETKRMASLLMPAAAKKYIEEHIVYRTYKLIYYSEFRAKGQLEEESSKPKNVILTNNH